MVELGGFVAMEAVTDAVEALLDREAIRDCTARLAHGVDRRDAALMARSGGTFISALGAPIRRPIAEASHAG
jgi:hypothetical protein